MFGTFEYSPNTIPIRYRLPLFLMPYAEVRIDTDGNHRHIFPNILKLGNKVVSPAKAHLYFFLI